MGLLVKFFWCNDATDCKSSEITIPSQRLQQECLNAPGIKHGLCQFAYSSGMGSNDKWYSWQRSYPHCFYWSWYQSILLAYVVCMIPHIQLSSPSEKFWYRSFISQFQCFFSLTYRTMDSFLCFPKSGALSICCKNPIMYFRVYSSGLVILSSSSCGTYHQ